MTDKPPHTWGRGPGRTQWGCPSKSPVTGVPCAGELGHPGPHSDSEPFTRGAGTFADISDGPG